MLTGILAVLSASVAAGMRIALPLMVVLFLHSYESWSSLPYLSFVRPRVLLAVLISWSLFEVFASKKLLGQRVLQIFQLIFSPLAGALIAIIVARLTHLKVEPIWLLGIVGALLALVVNLVQVSWFFRMRGIPIWIVIIEDILCVCLVVFAFHSPVKGGIIAMLIVWLAIRSSNRWRRWYLNTPHKDSNLGCK
jgi:hypothetical protein